MALKLKGSTSGFVAIDAPSVAGNNTLILPENSGSAFQIFANDITAGVTTFTQVTVSRNGDLTVPGTISIGGTLTYEDVTSVDSVGIVTARGLSIFGNTTGLSVTGVGTFAGDVSIADKIIHTGDTNTAIRFPSVDNISFETDGGERVRITSSILGINTTSVSIAGMSRYLSVSARDVTNGGGAVEIVGNRTGSDQTLGVINFVNDASNVAQITAKYQGSTTSGSMQFFTSGSERVRIDSSGRLLLGLTSSRSVGDVTAQSQIEGTSFSSSSLSLISNAGASAGNIPHITLGKSRGSSDGSNTIVAEGDKLGIIQFAGADGTDCNTVAASILSNVDGAPGSNDMPGRLTFNTTADGAATPTERMRLASNGSLSINYAGTGDNTLHIGCTSNAGGIIIKAPGDHYANMVIDSNRSGANNGIFNLAGRWNGNDVAYVSFTTGDDTTNKDDGYIRFYTRLSGSSLTEKVRFGSDGRVLMGPSSYSNISSNAVLTLKSSGSSATRLNLENSGSSSPESTQIFSQNNELAFSTSGSESLRIESDGFLKLKADKGLNFANQTITSTSNYNRTVDGEKLDYYEEGYMDPTAISAGLTFDTANNKQLRYVRIGHWVSVSGYLDVVSYTSNSNVIKIAMPFTSAPNSAGYYTRGTAAIMYRYVNLDTNYDQLIGYVGGDENYMRLFQSRSSSGDWLELKNSNLASTSAAFYFSVNYMVDD